MYTLRFSELMYQTLLKINTFFLDLKILWPSYYAQVILIL